MILKGKHWLRVDGNDVILRINDLVPEDAGEYVFETEDTRVTTNLDVKGKRRNTIAQGDSCTSQ